MADVFTRFNGNPRTVVIAEINQKKTEATKRMEEIRSKAFNDAEALTEAKAIEAQIEELSERLRAIHAQVQDQVTEQCAAQLASLEVIVCQLDLLGEQALFSSISDTTELKSIRQTVQAIDLSQGA